jgi:hypothetical protein
MNCSGRSGDHRAAACDPSGPVHETVGGIVRPDDESRPDDERSFAEHVRRRALAQGLQPAVVLEFGAELLDALVFERQQRTGLRGRLGEIRVDGDRRDEGVVRGGIRQRLGGGTHDPREVARRIDDGVPRAAGERGKVAVPIAAKMLRLGEQAGVRLPAVEEGHLMVARERRVDDRAAEKLRPAEDQTADRASSRRSTSSCVL